VSDALLPGLEEEPTVDGLWAAVVGQGPAVDALRAAAASPVHAYLLVGPEGSGKRAAAVAFTADLLSRAAGDESLAGRAVRLVAAGHHPSVTLVERDGASISAEQAREVARTSALAPPEGEVQVYVLDEFHLVRDAAPILLKSIEEPPPGTVFVVLAEEVPDDLVTIASRCVRVQLTAVPASVVSAALEAEGVPPEAAGAAAAACGGSMHRARLLAHDPRLVARRDAWAAAPMRLDGSGAAACAVADELLEAIEEVLAPLAEAHAEELAAFDAEDERFGTTRRGERGRIDARQRREARRVRVDELRAGLAALLGTYRERVGGEDPVGSDYAAAAARVQRLADSLRFNPNEALALRALLLGLPRLSAASGSA
jgi:DNA polymerase-3 subunit delta'